MTGMTGAPFSLFDVNKVFQIYVKRTRGGNYTANKTAGVQFYAAKVDVDVREWAKLVLTRGRIKSFAVNWVNDNVMWFTFTSEVELTATSLYIDYKLGTVTGSVMKSTKPSEDPVKAYDRAMKGL